MQKVLSFDQAANASGWSYWEDEKPIKWGVINPKPKNLKGAARLNSLYRQFSALIEEYKPDIVLIEDPVGGEEDRGGPTQNWKTMQVLCQVQGVLLLCISESGLGSDDKHNIVSPSSWQYTCRIHRRDRDGRKAGAREFVEKTYKISGVPQDVCDSFCIAFHYFETNRPERNAF